MMQLYRVWLVGLLFLQYWTLITGIVSLWQLPLWNQKGRKLFFEFWAIRTGFPQCQQCYWHYSGNIYNPLTGKVIAGIEGIESIHSLEKTLARNGSEISSPYSCLSKKCFTYVTPENRSQPLESFKFQKLSPRRNVSPRKNYYEILSLQENSSMINSLIQFSSKRNFSTSMIDISNPLSATRTRSETTVVDPTRIIPQVKVAHSLTAGKNYRFRNKWISFAPSSRITAATQETYSFYKSRRSLLDRLKINFLFPYDFHMHYKRIGLGPSWYAPGRSVVTEMKAKRYHSYLDLPIAIRELFQNEIKDEGTTQSLQQFYGSSDAFEQYKPWYSKFLFK